MRSRGDQLQAYRFLRRRVITSLMAGQPNGRDFPLRRLVPTSFAGAMATAVLLGGAAVLGALNPGHTSDWKSGSSLIIERETGARYVYYQGALHPMLNFASARLYLGDGSPTVYTVARSALAGVARTTPQGIPGAPDALPSSGDLLTGPWSVCVGPDGTVTELVGTATGGTALGALSGTVVSAGAGSPSYLVWRSRRLLIDDTSALAALGLADPTPRIVGASWLNTLPAGPDLTFPAVPGRGGAGPTVAGHALRIGQLVVVNSTVQTQYAVVLAGGLAPVTPVVAALIQADPRFAAAYPGGPAAPVQLAPDEYSQAVHLPALAGTGGYPSAPLGSVGGADSDSALCSTLTDPGSGAVSVSVVAGGQAAKGRVVVPTGSPATPTADRVAIPAGHGVLVREVPNPGVTTGTLFLLTDDGVRFPIDSSDAVQALGYGDVAAVGLPPGFVELLPVGPTLSRASAGRSEPPQ
jgi:type VII secretion protein EccB